MEDDLQLALALSLSSYEEDSHKHRINAISPKEDFQHFDNRPKKHISSTQDNCRHAKKVKVINSSTNIQHLIQQNDKQFDANIQKQQCCEKFINDENCLNNVIDHGETTCSTSCETPQNEEKNSAFLTLKKNLLPIQIEALANARRVLFSCLAGLEEPLAKDPDNNVTIVFTTQRLYQVMKALHITCSDRDVNTMMLYWKQEDTTHSHSSSQVENGLCKECWTNDFDLKEREKFTRSIRKNKMTQKAITLKPLECNWNQFCRIFQACNLKVEKNGVVW